MEDLDCMKRKLVLTNFWSNGRNLYEDELGWGEVEKRSAGSLISKEIFDFHVVLCGLNLGFYYVDNDTFYGIHREETPIEVKIMPRDRNASPYIVFQADTDTHYDGDVIYSFKDPKDLWDGICIDGKSLEEVLSRSVILTLA